MMKLYSSRLLNELRLGADKTATDFFSDDFAAAT
jgi:hypothetical protein